MLGAQRSPRKIVVLRKNKARRENRMKQASGVQAVMDWCRANSPQETVEAECNSVEKDLLRQAEGRQVKEGRVERER